MQYGNVDKFAFCHLELVVSINQLCEEINASTFCGKAPLE